MCVRDVNGQGTKVVKRLENKCVFFNIINIGDVFAY